MPLRSSRTQRSPAAAHRRANTTHSRLGPTWDPNPLFTKITVGPADAVAFAVSMPKRPDGAIRTERSTRGRPSLSGMQRGMEAADFTAKADGEKDSETQVAIRSIVTRGTC